MKWLTVILILMIAPACQTQPPATLPPGMPLDHKHSDMAAITKPENAAPASPQ